MAIDDTLVRRLGDREFWRSYFWLSDPLPTDAGQQRWVVESRPSERVAITLVFDSTFAAAGIDLFHVGRSGLIELAWADQAHPCQNLFRWEEMPDVCGAVSAQYLKMGTGAPLLLLCRFAPIVATDDAEAIREAIRRAMQAVGWVQDNDLDQVIRLIDGRSSPVRWKQTPGGYWALDGENTNSLRCVNNSAFPHELFQEFLDSSRRRADPDPRP